ncbi:MAG TPA: hypothetical protein VM425_00340 [Myxococcota bacterium]|nr:hypothetical protein [Myxococcota bacterium]
MRTLLALLAAISLVAPARADEIDTDGFESWQQAVASRPAQAAPAARQMAMARAQAEPVAEVSRPAADDQVSAHARDDFNPIIRFGAGATYMLSLRTADLASGKKVLTEFSASVCPLRAVFEVGFDLAMARDGAFFARPNLKLFLMRNLDYSLYVEGSLAVFSHPDGVDVGGGVGIGAVVGIIDNLGLEIFASAMMFSMSPAGAGSLVSGGIGGQASDASGFMVMPCIGARLVARF